MSSIKGPIGPEQLELFALELGKTAVFEFVYSLASTNINQSAPNLVTVNMSIRSQMSLIMGQVIPDQSVLSALEIEKLNFSSLFGIYQIEKLKITKDFSIDLQVPFPQSTMQKCVQCISTLLYIITPL